MKNSGKLIATLVLVLIIAIEAVVLIGGIGKLSSQKPDSKLPDYDHEALDKLEWRVLYPVEGLNCDAYEEDLGSIAIVTVGNFDNDQDEEICLPTSDGLVIFKLDKGYQCGQRAEMHENLIVAYGGVAWDMDRDGVDEIVPNGIPMEIPSDFEDYREYLGKAEGALDGYEITSVLPVFKANGEIADFLPYNYSSSLPAVGDVDGDGYNELLIGTSAHYDEFTAFGFNGEVIWEQKFDQDRDNMISPFSCIGDFDEDGREEWYQILRRNMCYGYDQEPLAMPSMHEVSEFISANLDGQGIDEIISSELIVYPETGGCRQLQYPGEPIEYGEIACGDYLEGGSQEIAVTSALDDLGVVYLFSTQGELMYEEHFNEPIYLILNAHAGGTDHLVINTQRRILVYP